MIKARVWKRIGLVLAIIVIPWIALESPQELHASEDQTNLKNSTFTLYLNGQPIADDIDQAILNKPELSNHIDKVNIKQGSQNTMSVEDWNIMKNALFQREYKTMDGSISIRTDITNIDASDIEIEGEVLPENAFANLEIHISLYFPNVTHISKSSMANLKEYSIHSITLPRTLETVEADALKGLFVKIDNTSYSEPSLALKGDFSSYHSQIANSGASCVNIMNFNEIANLDQPILQGMNSVRTLKIDGSPSTPLPIHLNTLFGNDVSNSQLKELLIYKQAITSLSVTDFPELFNITLPSSTSLTSATLKNNALVKIPAELRATATSLDVEGNRLDYTNTRDELKTYYDNHKDDTNFKFGEQRPIFRIKDMNDITIFKGATEPEMPLEFEYHDSSKVNFTSRPEWIKEEYFNSYEDTVTGTYKPLLNLKKIGTYTKTFRHMNTYLGQVELKIIADPDAPIKEAPHVELIASPTTNLTTDTEITFTANLSAVGSDDLNPGTSVTFKDGDAILGEVQPTNGEAVFTGKLSEGLHLIIAEYSGNEKYDYSESTDIMLRVSASVIPVKETPLISLSIDPTQGWMSDADITLSASLSKVGSEDLNTSATITFMDGTEVLSEVGVTEDGAEYIGKLSSGSHSITAVYSGNEKFETVTSTAKVLLVDTATDTGKENQTISFLHPTMNVVYGESVGGNSYSQSEEHGSGAITFSSSDTSIADVDAVTGEVITHKAGSVEITISVAEDDLYNRCHASYKLQISKKPLLIRGLVVEDKTYDGTSNANVDSTKLSLTGVLSGDVDKVLLTSGTAKFVDPNAGVDKVITLAGFALEGSGANNYSFTLPTLSADINKAELAVVVDHKSKKKGEVNPTLTYQLTGFVNQETQSSLSGYTPPQITTTAQRESEVGEYVIQASGAISDNYTFTYTNGILEVKETVVLPIDEKDYTISGSLGKNGWYVDHVEIKGNGAWVEIGQVNQSKEKMTWLSSLTFKEGDHGDIIFKLRKADGTESESKRISALKIDTSSPLAMNLKDGSTYYVNRVFSIPDKDVTKVEINGTAVSDFSKEILIDAEKEMSYVIKIEDKAGNITTYTINTKASSALASNIENLNKDNVKLVDKDTIQAVLAKINEQLLDESNAPSEKQLTSLQAMKQNCEELLAILNQQNPSVNKNVLTGDHSALPILVLLSLGSFGSLIWLSQYKGKKASRL